ncbi:MAG: exodeoxyribonuclease VII small subunit [Selenomonadaceae bacterium]|nr:exodeoxyribonuclease VII small subunit [Selenomonadaceae bacterium]MBQ1511346.1 exodeoxyribonuclease VII small subunit [Selenomonadaceae bacterium]MBQ1913779.1 exodeoxyribonuclease VII small subunit [Selenomonadaceae bacterium]MBQ3971420.1 exodeoxyribonuclease VII small subunit [Selenomonadaceae bacterium]
MPRKKEATFEENLGRLEAIVEQMESGEASLADLMKNYSEGVELSKKCMSALAIAEKTMDLLVKEENGTVQEAELKIEGE